VGMKKLNDALGKLGDVIGDVVDAACELVDKTVSSEDYGVTNTSITNGHVVINGSIKSLKINGYVIRVPDKVLRKR